MARKRPGAAGGRAALCRVGYWRGLRRRPGHAVYLLGRDGHRFGLSDLGACAPTAAYHTGMRYLVIQIGVWCDPAGRGGVGLP